MTREQEDHNSIWASRTSPDSFTATFGLSAPQRRARAGTLPSRLPSRLAPRIDTTAAAPARNGPSSGRGSPLSHLGSLALISPGGSDIVYDSFPPSSRSAVGQQPAERRRTPPLLPIPEPPTVSASDEAGSAGPAAAAPSLVPAPAPIPAALAAGGSLTPGLSTRSRAGSMNSVNTRPYPFNPFGNSIWGPGTMATMPSSSSGSSSGSSATTASSMGDGLSPFADPLHKSGLRGGGLGGGLAAAPNRMRSYTTMDAPPMDWPGAGSLGAAPLGGPALGPAPLPLGGGLPGLQSRHRAHTLLGASPAPLMSLGRMAQHPYSLDPDHNLLGEVGGVQLGDFSSVPTPALYVSNVPAHATAHTLQGIFGNFGRIDSAGVVPARRLAFVVFASTIQAIEAQATANGAELFLGHGISSVSFAQVLAAPAAGLAGTLASSRSSPSRSTRNTPPREPGPNGKAPSPASHGASSATPPSESLGARKAAAGDGDMLAASPISVAYVLQSLNAANSEVQAGVAHLRRAALSKFDEPILPLSEALPGEERVYNAAVLRDLRRKIEPMHPRDIEDLALDMQHELPSLASDYIGNTVVQLVFERSSSDVRDMMLRRLVPVFAATGTHKNGTWAVQKMIDLARGPRQYALIERAIRPHLVSLLLDQFGNYVVQACLKFGAPYNDFVYAGVASSLAKVAPSRFGARAVRALLESEHTTLANQRLVATAIVQQITSLALNANGCLLVSWLLDGFERVDPSVHAKTHTLVANQLIPRYLATLCSSKIGSGIIIKLASSTSSASSQRVFDSLLEPLTDEVPALLVEVLEDPTGQGPATIYRLLTSVFALNSLERQVTVNKVRMCLLRPGAVIPNHKRLLEECGLEMLQPTVPAAGGVPLPGAAFGNAPTSPPWPSNGSGGPGSASGGHPGAGANAAHADAGTGTHEGDHATSGGSDLPTPSDSPAASPAADVPSATSSGSVPASTPNTDSSSVSSGKSAHASSDPPHSHHSQRHNPPSRPGSSPSPSAGSASSSKPPLMMQTGIPVRYTH